MSAEQLSSNASASPPWPFSDPFSATASTVTSWPQSSNSHAPGHRKFPTREASNSTIRLNVAAVTMRTDRACPVTFAPVLNHLCPQRCIAWFPSRAPSPLLDTKMLPGAIRTLSNGIYRMPADVHLLEPRSPEQRRIASLSSSPK